MILFKKIWIVNFIEITYVNSLALCTVASVVTILLHNICKLAKKHNYILLSNAWNTPSHLCWPHSVCLLGCTHIEYTLILLLSFWVWIKVMTVIFSASLMPDTAMCTWHAWTNVIHKNKNVCMQEVLTFAYLKIKPQEWRKFCTKYRYRTRKSMKST